jgi:hypothetical protein
MGGSILRARSAWRLQMRASVLLIDDAGALILTKRERYELVPRRGTLFRWASAAGPSLRLPRANVYGPLVYFMVVLCTCVNKRKRATSGRE